MADLHIEATRGELVESVHRVSVAVADAVWECSCVGVGVVGGDGDTDAVGLSVAGGSVFVGESSCVARGVGENVADWVAVATSDAVGVGVGVGAQPRTAEATARMSSSSRIISSPFTSPAEQSSTGRCPSAICT